jgi:uncharacterized repeat protein (TIGR03803 family)
MSKLNRRRLAAHSIQVLERRVLLSSYLLQPLATLSPNTGSSGLTMDSHGNLFGATEFGGADNDGQIFEIAATTGAFTTVASFDGVVGEQPFGGVVLDGSGDIFGTADGPNNDGSFQVFEIPAGTNTIQTVATFPGDEGPFAARGLADAASSSLITNPAGGLIIDSQGNLYGIGSGGAFQNGQVFEIPAGTNTIDTLASFPLSVQAGDDAGLVMDSQGNLYGTTSQDGANDDGSIFEVAAGSGQITPLATFNGTNGADPGSNSTTTLNVLTIDSNGDLFGTTDMGGTSNDGTVFELPAGSGTINTLASFDNGSNSANPGGVILDANGNLFGTTMSAGSQQDGSVFELVKNSGVIATLASFTNGAEGLGPIAGLVMDANGNLYGEGRDAAYLVTKLTFVTQPFPGLLDVPGTAGADTISVNSSGGLLTASLNGQTDGPFVAGINGAEAVSVSGGAGNDMIDLSGITSGTSLLDAQIAGGAGADSIIGSQIIDNITGGKGADTISGGAGNDTINGAKGKDSIRGGAGDDSLTGGAGSDTVRGGAGNDTIVAGSGSSSLFAGVGDDSITGGVGAGFGADSIFCGGSTDTIDAGAGDQIFNSVPGDQITGGHIE